MWPKDDQSFPTVICCFLKPLPIPRAHGSRSQHAGAHCRRGRCVRLCDRYSWDERAIRARSARRQESSRGHPRRTRVRLSRAGQKTLADPRTRLRPSKRNKGRNRSACAGKRTPAGSSRRTVLNDRDQPHTCTPPTTSWLKAQFFRRASSVRYDLRCSRFQPDRLNLDRIARLESLNA